MENRAHYALIGTFVLVALFAIIAFVAWLSSAQFDQQFDEYEVTFNGAVRGLSQGSEVRFNGLKVGEVRRLRLDCLLYTSPSPRDQRGSRMPSSA